MEGSSNPKLVASIIDERRKRLQSMKAAGRSHEIISLIGVDRKPSDKSGLLDENKKGPTSHILARAIVLGYIVKMTSLQDAALPGEFETSNTRWKRVVSLLYHTLITRDLKNLDLDK